MISPFIETRGVLYVAFGRQYARVAAASAASVHEQCGLPCHVVTNVAPSDFSWPDGTTFERVDMPDTDNRLIRTAANQHSPFDRTLMLDADTLVASDHVAKPLRMLDHFDLCLVTYKSLSDWKQHPSWRTIHESLGCGMHSVFLGGCIYFRKTAQTDDFFRRWRGYWEDEGRGRDMPPLFRAAIASSARFWPIRGHRGWIGRKDAHILHAVSGAVGGLPVMEYKLRPGVADEGGRVTWEKRYCGGRKPAEPSEQPKKPKRPAKVVAVPSAPELRPSIRHVRHKLAGQGLLVGAEVGVYRGDHAAAILHHLPLRRLHLVDPWNAYDADGVYGQWIRQHRGDAAWKKWVNKDWGAVYDGVLQRFAGDPRVQLHRARSAELNGAIYPGELDFAYIDGAHDYEQVGVDLRQFWGLVRPGGVLCGHDHDAETQADVVRAVADFGTEIGQAACVSGTDFWFDKSEAVGC